MYGLPEVYRDALAGATSLAAAPGCYPTGSLLPAAAATARGPGRAHRDPRRREVRRLGGRTQAVEDDFLFAELDGNCKRVQAPATQHRHAPEIEQEAAAVAGAEVRLSFVPHLLPTVRGIVTSVYARPRGGASAGRAREALEAAYADERFVRVLPEGETPSLQAVRGSNFCDVAAFPDERNDTLILLSALDNLTKGASGAAVQCANLMCGLPEELALLDAPLVP